MIVAHSFTKRCGKTLAVDDLSFTVAPGVVTALGPNGSGESTTMHMILGLDLPDSGSAVTPINGSPSGTVGLLPMTIHAAAALVIGGALLDRRDA
jgi:ABC-type multidrug transport system ATPase subunit